MVPFPFLRDLLRNDKPGFCLCLLTALICVLLDPVMGLAAGAVIALLINAMGNQKSRMTVVHTREPPNTSTYVPFAGSSSGAHRVVIRGQVCFMNAEEVLKAGSALPRPSGGLDVEAASTAPIVLDLSALTLVDYDGVVALHKLVALLDLSGKEGASLYFGEGQKSLPAKHFDSAAALQKELHAWLDSRAAADGNATQSAWASFLAAPAPPTQAANLGSPLLQ